MRKDHIDRLRNAGILFLFPFHTSRVFNDLESFYVKGEVNTPATVLVDLSYWFMPLLFLLAGMSSLYALRRRSARTYVNERFSRLLVPFFFGVLVVVPPQAHYAMKFHLGYRGGYGEFLWSYFTDFSDWSEYAGGISPAHLWFIAFLFLISIALLPVMRAMLASGYSPTWMRNPFLILPPSAGVAALSLLPDVAGKNIVVFAAYFLLGFLIATDDAIGEMIERNRRVYLAAAVLTAAAVLAQIHVLGVRAGAPALLLEHLACWPALLAMLGYAKRYLNRRTRFAAYFTPAAFPVYILHQTYLVVVAYYVVRAADLGAVAFALIMSLSFALSLATYELIRRLAPARALFGLPASPAGPASAAGPVGGAGAR
ncbi:acyltransferase family protein [Nocardiopsis mangrovi]|uniref:Acyltransferase family protein n=1 Tax=Nocardiopsis mangrovi TaxID=1179818 RepID=A0ABV9DZW6_9ACTN